MSGDAPLNTGKATRSPKQGMNRRRPAADQPTIESGIPPFCRRLARMGRLGHLDPGGITGKCGWKGIPGDLITRGNVVIFSFSDLEGNPRGECAVSIVEDAGGNV